MKYLCKIEKNDDFNIENAHSIVLEDNSMFTYTFWEQSYKNVTGKYSNIAIDLLYISLFVFYIDRIHSRDVSIDSWSRNINMNIPVIELEKWDSNKELLQNMLNFLSGDTWKIEFRKREITEKEKKYLNKINDKESDDSVICMFSGGLDSFIGAIDILEENKNVIFVSHYGGGKGTREFQQYLKNILKEKYGINEENFFSFYAAAKEGVEDTTRTRSFMFFSHAIAIASTLNKNVKLIIPENGLISLNIPLTYSRLGSSSTRTTHPHYMGMFKELLNKLGFTIEIKNPYQFKTKGEMILECKNIELLKENIDKTMSCSHPDAGRMFKEVEAKHCGYCLPCIVRRASIKKGIGIDKTEYRDKDFKKHKVAKENLNSYLLGIKRYNKNSAIMKIQLSGEIKENINLYADLYNRGIDELKAILEDYYE